jgi:CHAD domain-containing protein
MARASPQKDFTIRKSAAHDARSKLCAQIGAALRYLRAVQPSDEQIHEARKAIKRSRATLRLLRPTLSDRAYRLENATLARSMLDSRGWADLGDGLQRVYARGRKALRAARANCTTECLHEWRKQTKYLLYQLELLQPIAPHPIQEMARRAHRLSNRLGDDHDLTVLRQKAFAHQDAFRARGELDALLDAIAHRQSRLRKKAFKIGAKLYDSKPGRFRKRLDSYWTRAPEP